MLLDYILLDTNVIINDPQIIFNYPNSYVVIHFLTLSELDSFKKEGNERGYNAREAIRIIEELRLKGSLFEGVSLENGSIFKIMNTYSLPVCHDTIHLTNSVDDQIITLGLNLKTEKKNVTLVSKDLTLRIKASQFDIKVSDNILTKKEYI